MGHRLSIVTVVKDDLPGFNRTLASLAQSSPGALLESEWIVVDSSSHTQEIPQAVQSSPLTCQLAWTPPEGVFEAMNTGLAMASGDYVYFLNAGDTLHSAASLPAILTGLSDTNPAWLYGQVAFVNGMGALTVPPRFNYSEEERALFARGRFPPHQGTVVNRRVLLELGGFDVRYRIAADYALALRLSQISAPTEVTEVIADFAMGGISQRRWRDSVREFHAARQDVFEPQGIVRAKETLYTARQALLLWANSLR